MFSNRGIISALFVVVLSANACYSVPVPDEEKYYDKIVKLHIQIKIIFKYNILFLILR